MGLSLQTAYKWITIEEVLDRIHTRNKKLRIINDALFVKVAGGDPIKCWNAHDKVFVYVSKNDWIKASPAITTLEAAKLIRITPYTVIRKRNDLGIMLKPNTPGKLDGVPKQQPGAYFSISDVIEIANNTSWNGRNQDPASELEIRRLFAQGYTAYKKLSNGEFVPIWEETI
jgi:hypothetical protein